MIRRTFLASAVGAGAAALAGCTTASGSLAPPDVPTDLLESGGWTRQDQRQDTIYEQEFGPATVTAQSYQVTYADTALADDVADRTLGSVDSQLSIFFASRINFSPDLDNLPLAVGRDALMKRVREEAAAQFVGELESRGLTNVRETDSGTLDVDTGETAALDRYAADYEMESMSFRIAEDAEVTVDGSALTIAGMLATWHHGDYVIVAGGAYPAENVAQTSSHELSSAISVTVDIDLGFEPAAYERELLDLIVATK